MMDSQNWKAEGPCTPDFNSSCQLSSPSSRPRSYDQLGQCNRLPAQWLQPRPWFFTGI